MLQVFLFCNYIYVGMLQILFFIIYVNDNICHVVFFSGLYIYISIHVII